MEILDVIVWVFHGMGGRFTSGVFSSRERAEAWIASHQLTGVLTCYPVDKGVYDWSIQSGFFKVKKDEQLKAEFIQKFTSASQEHYHYEDGHLD